MRTFTIRHLLLIGTLALSGCALSSTVTDHPTTPLHLIAPDGNVITVNAELALTSAEMERGLMNRPSLKADEGMLFVFAQTTPLSFWMKNTLIPLDILFFDDYGKIVSYTTMQPCPPEKTETCPIYASRGPARYALEVPAGWVRNRSVTTTPLRPQGGERRSVPSEQSETKDEGEIPEGVQMKLLEDEITVFPYQLELPIAQ
ncbi:MAG: DUF192 domain-containing protein [Candidatus Peregrinibacteria bacterium]